SAPRALALVERRSRLRSMRDAVTEHIACASCSLAARRNARRVAVDRGLRAGGAATEARWPADSRRRSRGDLPLAQSSIGLTGDRQRFHAVTGGARCRRASVADLWRE